MVRLRFPHPLTLLVGCVLLAALLTWVLPAGRYERREDQATGRTLVVAGTYGPADPSPVVELNLAVAVAMAAHPATGLALMDGLAADGRLDDYPYLHAARADLLRRLDRRTEAAVVYRRALELTANDAERAFLRRRLAEVEAGPVRRPD